MQACGELVPYAFLGSRDKARALAVISSGIRFPDALINGLRLVDHDPALITVNNISWASGPFPHGGLYGY